LTNKGYDFRPLYVPQVSMNGMELKLERFIEDEEKRRIKLGPVKRDSMAVINSFDEETGKVNIIDSLGNEFDMDMAEINNKIRDNTIDAS
jgi:hypothetical protein